METGELFDGICCTQEFDNRTLLKEGMKFLSERQRAAVALRYIYGYSDAEIAHRLGITRQEVNRLERLGLEILREYFGV